MLAVHLLAPCTSLLYGGYVGVDRFVGFPGTVLAAACFIAAGSGAPASSVAIVLCPSRPLCWLGCDQLQRGPVAPVIPIALLYNGTFGMSDVAPSRPTRPLVHLRGVEALE